MLVGTVSIDKSEELSALLKAEKIPHTVLNAKYHEREAEIIAQAGKEGAVTISTNMAGRGTDIMLGGNAEYLAKNEMRREGVAEEMIAAATGTADTSDEEILAARAHFAELYAKYKEEIAPEAERVRAAGGLYILGTERHESRRIDNQLRGRSGRQGDPGASCFFLSLEDDLMRLFASDRTLNLLQGMGVAEDTPISAGILSGTIERAQKRIEGMNFSRRKSVLDYDDVMNQQRKIIYEQRREVLDGDDLHDTITKMFRDSVHSTVLSFYAADDEGGKNPEGLHDHYAGWLFPLDDERFSVSALASLSADEAEELLLSQVMTVYAAKEALFGADAYREVERVVLLRNVDANWMEHLDAMDDIKDSVGLNGYAQRNPITEYRIQGADLFDAMVDTIRESTVKMLLTVVPRADATKRVEVAKATGESGGGSEEPKKPAPVKTKKKVGRNDPCPCGSGKKYKACCGKNPNIVD